MLYILETYGSTWPGSRGYVDDIGGKIKEEESNEKKDDIENGGKALRDETFATEFGNVRSSSIFHLSFLLISISNLLKYKYLFSLIIILFETNPYSYINKF
jgi:hypothetical protein